MKFTRMSFGVIPDFKHLIS